MNGKEARSVRTARAVRTELHDMLARVFAATVQSVEGASEFEFDLVNDWVARQIAYRLTENPAEDEGVLREISGKLQAYVSACVTTDAETGQRMVDLVKLRQRLESDEPGPDGPRGAAQ